MVRQQTSSLTQQVFANSACFPRWRCRRPQFLEHVTRDTTNSGVFRAKAGTWSVLACKSPTAEARAFAEEEARKKQESSHAAEPSKVLLGDRGLSAATQSA